MWIETTYIKHRELYNILVLYNIYNGNIILDQITDTSGSTTFKTESKIYLEISHAIWYFIDNFPLV
jgi:hypothetical protein